MGTNYYLVRKEPTLIEPLHIGKRSGGWKFLFHDVSYWDTDWNVELHTYQDWISYLEKAIVEDDEAVILNEYEERVYFREFIDIVQNAQRENNPNDFINAKNVDGYRFMDGDFS